MFKRILGLLVFFAILFGSTSLQAQAQGSVEDAQTSHVFVIFNFEIKDEAKWREYVPQAGATISEW